MDSALEKLRSKRALDVESAGTLLKLGWRQIGPHEGLQWCVTCSQPTIWKDDKGSPKHVWCSEISQA